MIHRRPSVRHVRVTRGRATVAGVEGDLVGEARLMKKSLAQRLQYFPLSVRVFLNYLENFLRDRDARSRRWLLIARSGSSVGLFILPVRSKQ